MKVTKHTVYVSLALGMLIYAVPKLEIGQGWTLPTIYSIVWIVFALLIIAAQLHFVFGVDEEARKQLRRIKFMKMRQRERVFSRGNPVRRG